MKKTVFLLLFADDVALVSSTPVGLQHQLNILKAEADRLKLVVNLDKTNIVVFRKGGILSRNEKWLYGDKTVQVVNAYKYLGLTFTTMLSKVRAVSDFVLKAKRKIVFILKASSRIKCNQWSVFSQIFDVQVVSGLLYGSEVWGCCKLDAIEQVQVFAIKCFLKLHVRAPTAIVYGESERYPLHLLSQLRCITYWLRVLKLNPGRLPKSAYTCSFQLSERGKACWAAEVKKVLLCNGFAEVWYNQGPGNDGLFLREFTQRFQDCHGQSWHENIVSHSRFVKYSLLKCDFDPDFTTLDLQVNYRSPLLKFRAGVSWIRAHRLRFADNADITCPFCPGQIEDEYHVLFGCKAYHDIRTDMLKCKPHEMKERFQSLLSTCNDNVLRSLAIFLLKAHKKNSSME